MPVCPDVKRGVFRGPDNQQTMITCRVAMVMYRGRKNNVKGGLGDEMLSVGKQSPGGTG